MDNPNGILNDLLGLWSEQKTTNKPNDSDHQATPSTMLGQVSNNHKNDSNICTAVPSSTLFQDLVMEDDTMDNTDDCENNPSIALHHLNTFAGLEKRSDSRFMSQSRNGHKKPCKDQLMKRGNEHIGPSYLAKSSCRIQKSHRRYHSPHVIRILRSWLMQHLDNPYPNPDEKVMLRVKTGMTATQLNDWFTNARRRNIPKILGENKHCMNSPQYANAITMPSAPNTMRMTTSLPQYQTYDYNPQSLVGLGLQEWPMYRQTSSQALPERSIGCLNSTNLIQPTNNNNNNLLNTTVLYDNPANLQCQTYTMSNNAYEQPSILPTNENMNESVMMDAPLDTISMITNYVRLNNMLTLHNIIAATATATAATATATATSTAETDDTNDTDELNLISQYTL